MGERDAHESLRSWCNSLGEHDTSVRQEFDLQLLKEYDALRVEVERMKEGWITLNELYRKHHECFGCDEEDDLEAQCEFEDELCKLLCNALGHVYGPDQCGKPEHDYCYRCKKLRITDIG